MPKGRRMGRLREGYLSLASSVAGLLVLLTMAAAVGAALGRLAWSLSAHPVEAAAIVRVVNDQASLSSVLTSDPNAALSAEGFVAGEVSRLGSDAFAQQLTTALGRPVDPLTVSQVATSDLVQVSTSDPEGDRAVATLDKAIALYREGRQGAARAALAADLKATEARLTKLNASAGGDGANQSTQNSIQTEIARLLAHQSDLVAAQARVTEMVPVVNAPAVVPPAGIGPGLMQPLLGAVALAFLAALGAAAVRLRDQSVRVPADLTAMGYRVLMPVFDLSRSGTWDSTARIIMAQLTGAYASPSLVLLAVEPDVRADVVASVLAGEGQTVDALGGAPRVAATAFDVKSILTRRNDPSDNAILVVALGRTRRQSVMGALRAVTATGMPCAGVIITTGQVEERGAKALSPAKAS